VAGADTVAATRGQPAPWGWLPDGAARAFGDTRSYAVPRPYPSIGRARGSLRSLDDWDPNCITQRVLLGCGFGWGG
jgi:hypothetical protein